MAGPRLARVIRRFITRPRATTTSAGMTDDPPRPGRHHAGRGRRHRQRRERARWPGGGGVDGAIHRAGGRGHHGRPGAPLRPGPASARRGAPSSAMPATLPARIVIHAVGPVWRGGDAGEPELLAARLPHLAGPRGRARARRSRRLPVHLDRGLRLSRSTLAAAVALADRRRVGRRASRGARRGHVRPLLGRLAGGVRAARAVRDRGHARERVALAARPSTARSSLGSSCSSGVRAAVHSTSSSTSSASRPRSRPTRMSRCGRGSTDSTRRS